MVYVHMPYDEMNVEQHNEMLRRSLAAALNYIDGETFKVLLLGQPDDYLLQFIHDRRKETGGKL